MPPTVGCRRLYSEELADLWPESDDGFRFPVMGKGITNVRRLTAADLETTDVSRLVSMSQDHWHLLNRMWQLIAKNALDLQSFKAASSKAVAIGSCQFNEPYSAATPVLLVQQARRDALILQRNLLGLIDKFRWQQTVETREERMDNAVRILGAALNHQAERPHRSAEASPPFASETLKRSSPPEGRFFRAL